MAIELGTINDRVAALDREIKSVAGADDGMRRLMEIPGVGPTIATALVAAVGDGKPFRKGRVSLAALPEDKALAILTGTTLAARTPNTLTDPVEFIAELARILARGYAIIDQEVELGLRSIAVPLMNVHGKTIAALNIGVAAVQSTPEALARDWLPSLINVQTRLRPLLR